MNSGSQNAPQKEVGEVRAITDAITKDLHYQRELAMTLVDRLSPVLPCEQPNTKDPGVVATPTITPLGDSLDGCHRQILGTTEILKAALSQLEL